MVVDVGESKSAGSKGGKYTLLIADEQHMRSGSLDRLKKRKRIEEESPEPDLNGELKSKIRSIKRWIIELQMVIRCNPNTKK